MATFFVNSTTGDDADNGSSGSPVASLTQAFQLVKAAVSAGPDDHGPHEIQIQDGGTYQEGNLGRNPSFSAETVIFIMALTGSDGRPIASPIVRGSGSAGVQDYAFFCGRSWIIRGIEFENWIIASSTSKAVIAQRDVGSNDQTFFLTVEDCTFRNITGSCINITGNDDPGPHTIQRNRFHKINSASGSGTNTITLTNNNKFKIVNNLFYDIQFGNVNSLLINAAGTRAPATIISHNTFGTSSCEQPAKPRRVIEAELSKFEYNIIYGYDTSNSFADIEGGEANYNIHWHVTGSSSDAPFGVSGAPTSSNGNISNKDALLKGPLVQNNGANYRLKGITSPAFDAAIGSADVSLDFTGGSRAILDRSALETGIFDIGAFELTGLFSLESQNELPDFGADFTINRIPNADNQNKRGLEEGNSSILGHDVDQVPLFSSINGAVPSLIRKRPNVYKQDSGKKGT